MEYYINPKAIILQISGKDSRRYLNARLSNDVKSLTPGNGCYGAALSPQGRAEGYFLTLCISENEFLAICDGGHKETVIPALKRYLVADRVEVKDISDQTLILTLFNPNSELIKDILGIQNYPSNIGDHVKTDNFRLISAKRSASPAFDLIADISQIEELKSAFSRAGITALGEDQFLLQSMKAGIPVFPKELNEDVIFSASGLDYAVSFKKGCYVGQEVIEKIDAYGKVPYLLKVISVKGRHSDRPQISFNGKELNQDKIISSGYDSGEDTTYYFVELKNADNLLDSEILIDNNPALLCKK